MAEFPTHPDAVTPGWLSEALGLHVDAVEWSPIGTGQVADSVRFLLSSREAGTTPATLAAKFPAADATSRGTASLMGLYAKEVRFYREIAPLLDVRVPEVHFAGLSADGSEFVLLFEDLGPARGGDQIAGCTLADAEAAIRQAAAVHAPSWGNAEILERDWLQVQPDLTAQLCELYPQAQGVWRERYVDLLEPEYMALCEEIAALSDRFFAMREEEPIGLVHGDFRLDNMLFDIRGGAEPAAVLDWQTVSLGNPLTDIGYFLGCGIGHELRSANEDHLLDLYCTEMGRRGVSITRDKIWDDYRRGALSGLTTAVFSASFVERTERGDANFLSMARGACALALDHDALATLKERCDGT
ncbi:phosphotransferase family protein [Qipengyuania sp. CAU 1752]